MRGPLMLVAARARRRPSRWLIPALGIALAVAFGAGVAAEGVIAGDQGARAKLADLAPLDRAVRVTWQGPVTPDATSQARGLLRGLGLGQQTEVTLLTPVRLSGVVVRPVALSPLDRWLPGAEAGPCRATGCPVVLAGGGHVPGVLSAAGVKLTVVGSDALRSSVPLTFAPAIDGGLPVLVTGDTSGLDAVPGLSGVYRTHTWLATLDVPGLHSWQLGSLERRLYAGQARLQAGTGQFSVTGPFGGLDAARSEASAAPARLLLVGGGVLASLALFVVLAASGLRIEQRSELRRLAAAGARAWQSVAFVVGEAGWICAVAVATGGGAGVLLAALLASGAGEPVGAVLSHSVLTPVAAAALAGGWVAATALMSVVSLSASGRLLDLLAVAAASVIVAGLSVGTASDRGWTLLLAPLCSLAGAVIVFRLAQPAVSALERLARGGPVLARLALVGLARARALPAVAIAFVAVSVGLGGFALAYRATLLRGAADQAASRVPLDALVSTGPDFATPLNLAPLARWRSLARGTALPVRSTTATYASGSGSVTVPALGVPVSGLRLMHGWRASYSPASLSALARRLRPPGPARTPGPPIAAGTRSLSVGIVSPALAVMVSADLRDPGGAVRRVAIGARIPAGRWELEALELSEPAGLEATNGHQNAESPTGAPRSVAEITLGPVHELGAGDRVLGTVQVGGWRGVGAAAVGPRVGSRLEIRFDASAATGVIRPTQPTDTSPVPVLADPQTAAAAGPGGRVAMLIDQLPVAARVVGVVRHFPTVPAGAAGFVVADQALLSAALDAGLPGQGRPDQLWIASSHLGPLRRALAAAPLAQLSSLFRPDLERQLRDTPIARGVLRALIAAAVLTSVLAILGMLLALLGAFRDASVERDLDEQGLGPRALRSELRARFVFASVLGGLGGLGIALVETRLAVASVGAAIGDSHPQPPLVTVAPWVGLVAWTIGSVAVVALAGWLATSTAGVARRRPSRGGEDVHSGRDEVFTEAIVR